jgi:hypothetical protein
MAVHAEPEPPAWTVGVLLAITGRRAQIGAIWWGEGSEDHT